MSDPTLSDIDFKNKWLGSELPLSKIWPVVWGTLFLETKNPVLLCPRSIDLYMNSYMKRA